MTEPRPSAPLDPESKSLRRAEDDSPVLAAAAFAEAFRLQAEALNRLDRTQRKIVDTLERSEKAQNLVASTRALNETFRGLSRIQRGLLDAVLSDKGRGRGMPLVLVAALALSLVLGFLLVQKKDGAEPARLVQVERELTDARAEQQRLRGMEEETRKRAAKLEGELRGDLATAREGLAAYGASEKRTETEMQRLRDKASEADGLLQNFLTVKARAERAAEFEVTNIDLRQRLTNAQRRIRTLEEGQARLAGMVAEERIAARSPADAVLEAARKKGLIKRASAPAPGPQELKGREKRNLRRRVNRLLQAASGKEAYELLQVGGVDGGKLLDVSVGRYEGARMLNSLQAKEMEIFVDLEAQTVELLLRRGQMLSVARPGSPLALPAGGHSIFLTGVGVRRWLESVAQSVERAPDGRLTWIITGS
ncbi:MAG: hypothetical protein ACE10D_03195 [Planctomycetota bacterium]|nr:hypothetical protein [Planctomycetota bacterium]